MHAGFFPLFGFWVCCSVFHVWLATVHPIQTFCCLVEEIYGEIMWKINVTLINFPMCPKAHLTSYVCCMPKATSPGRSRVRLRRVPWHLVRMVSDRFNPQQVKGVSPWVLVKLSSWTALQWSPIHFGDTCLPPCFTVWRFLHNIEFWWLNSPLNSQHIVFENYLP